MQEHILYERRLKLSGSSFYSSGKKSEILFLYVLRGAWHEFPAAGTLIDYTCLQLLPYCIAALHLLLCTEPRLW